MSRSQERKCCYSRWSEPILYRKHSMHLIPTSEEDTSSVRRSRSSSPLVNVLHPRKPHLELETGCCSCHNHCRKKKFSKIHTSPNSSKKSKDLIRSGSHSQQIRESLEIQLVRSQVEEALAGDKLAPLIHHLELATDALEALIQHINCLKISHFSAQRVVYLAHRMILPHSFPVINYTNSLSTDLTARLCQAESCKENRLRLLCDVMESCSKNITVSKQLQSLIDDHRTKKENFTIAARNFKNLLKNSKLTVSQMDKLQWQYQSIMEDYKQNRKVLESELPKIVKTRLGAIRQGFCMISDFYEDTEYINRISDLLKILSETLCQEETATDHHKYEKSQVQEICQKCKVNTVEK